MSRTHKARLNIFVAAAISITGLMLIAEQAIEKIHNGHRMQMEFLRMDGVSENSQLIAELQQGVDMLDKQVNKGLDQAKERMRTVKFVPVVVTAYNPVAGQTDGTPEITASNKRVRPGIAALSRDLEKEFGFKFGDDVVIEGIGCFVFEDRMNKRWSRRVDILMTSMEAARKFGVQNSFLMVSD